MTTLSIPRRRPDEIAPGNPQGKNKANTNLLGDAQSGSHSHTDTQNGKAARKKRKLFYPTGDGKPMAEDTLHRKLMAYCCDALEFHFASRADVYVAGNDFVYYQKDNPKARVSPDCYVVIGVEKRRRHFYKVWEENDVTPAVVIELTSKKTKKEDVTIKKPLYEQTLHVQEYFQFDPTGDYLSPRLQGQRLQDGHYQPMELHDNRMFSEQLGLELVISGETLRFYDPATGETLPTYEEAETLRLAQEQRAEEADKRAEAAEAELSRLREELEALRRQR